MPNPNANTLSRRRDARATLLAVAMDPTLFADEREAIEATITALEKRGA